MSTSEIPGGIQVSGFSISLHSRVQDVTLFCGSLYRVGMDSIDLGGVSAAVVSMGSSDSDNNGLDTLMNLHQLGTATGVTPYNDSSTFVMR